MTQLRHHGISRKKAQLRMDALRTAPAILPNAKPTPRVFAVVASVTQTSLRRNPVPNEEIYRPDNGDFKGRVTNHHGIRLARDDYSKPPMTMIGQEQYMQFPGITQSRCYNPPFPSARNWGTYVN